MTEESVRLVRRPNGLAKLRGRVDAADVEQRDALVSFSDHWAERFRDDACVPLTVVRRNDQPKTFSRDRELLLDELRRQPQYAETETS